MELALKDFKTRAQSDPTEKSWQTWDGLQARDYRSELGGWNHTLVEIGPDADRPMMGLAMYKIGEGQFAEK